MHPEIDWSFLGQMDDEALRCYIEEMKREETDIREELRRISERKIVSMVEMDRRRLHRRRRAR